MKAAMKWPWLAVALGVGATVIGIVITAMNAKSESDDAGTYLILGGILTAFGPVVLSHAVSKNLGRREALEEVHDHLGSISMNLGHSAAMLDNALRRNAAQVEPTQVTLNIAHNAVSSMEVQIGQLQKLIGEPFSADVLLETKGQLVTLADNLTKAAEKNDPDAVLEVTRGIERAVRKLRKPVGEPAEEEVRCPACANHVTLSVPDLPGATAHATCSNCDTVFTVHRDGQGVPFVRIASRAAVRPALADRHRRLPGTSTEDAAKTADADSPQPPEDRPRKLTLQCPSCQSSVMFWRRANTTQTVVCLACDTGLAVGADGSVLRQVDYSRAKVDVQRAARTGYVVRCPGCQAERSCKISVADGYFGYCSDDALTLEVTADAIARYRAKAA